MTAFPSSSQINCPYPSHKSEPAYMTYTLHETSFNKQNEFLVKAACLFPRSLYELRLSMLQEWHAVERMVEIPSRVEYWCSTQLLLVYFNYSNSKWS